MTKHDYKTNQINGTRECDYFGDNIPFVTSDLSKYSSLITYNQPTNGEKESKKENLP